MKIFSLAAKTAAFVLVAGSVNAATYTFVAVPGFVSGTRTETFDISAAIGSNEEVYSARLTASLIDDGDRRLTGTSQVRVAPYSRTEYYTETYRCGVFNLSTCTRTLSRTVPVYNYRTAYNYYDERESARLTVGSQFDADSTGYFDRSFGYNYDRGFTGSMFLDIRLGTANIADLNSDGELMAQLSMTTGDAILRSMRLTVFTNTVSTPPADVPLPASAALLLAGVGGMALMRRRRKT